jgi:hypothetical protein
VEQGAARWSDTKEAMHISERNGENIPVFFWEVPRTRRQTCWYTSTRVDRTKWAGGVCFGTIQQCFSDLHTHRWASTRQRLQRRMWSDKLLRVSTTYQASLAKGRCVVVEAKF